ncbi:M48 family metallopeptidase [Halarcobacter bivalviorum]|uniref:M48 family metallopeptidase n=1 Tax=Halarcobacter bivalviorum TaxID=663364 RepID=UPI001D194083|nr:M48 family metallopeptidase [Halarcobacter bivalviorum]
MIEEFKVKINQEIYNVTIRKKISNKHVYLRLKDKNLLEISSYKYFSKIDALDLINRQKEWIVKRREYFFNKEKNNNSYLLYGKRYLKNNLDDKELELYYKEEAKKIIPKLVDEFAKKMNLFPTSIKYRKNKRTWGSCNYRNGLNFNILLIQFPIEVIEYVVIHELAHIKHKNHSKSFWNLVEKYCQDYKQREKLLKSFL